MPEQPKIIPGKIRYPALLLSCFFAFGGYLVFDLCSALKDQMTSEFHISDTQYSLFYVVYAWTNWFATPTTAHRCPPRRQSTARCHCTA